MAEYGLKGKTAVITGVGRKKGIGCAIANALAAEGANIFTTFYTPYDLEQKYKTNPSDALKIIKALRKKGVRADGMEADLRDPESYARIFDAAEKTAGPVDILVNNACICVNADALGITPELLDDAYKVNLRAAAMLSNEFAKRFKKKTGGRIILLTSGQGAAPMPDEIPYVLSKAGLDVFANSASVTLAKKGITINAIDPGATDTGWMSKGVHAKIKKANPAGRVGMPEDAAKLAVFLASEQAGWITGQVIRSNGGGW